MTTSIRTQKTRHTPIGMFRVRRLGSWSSSLLAALLLFPSLLVVPAQAVEVVVPFEASMVGGTCFADCFASLGLTLSGTFTYESTSSGSGANPTTYSLSSFDFTTVTGVIGGATFGTLAIANNVSAPPADAVTIAGGGLFGAASTATLTALNLQMIDQDATVFSNTDLPTFGPPLSAFETAFLNMTWNQSGIPSWTPTWQITSMTWPPVPVSFAVYWADRGENTIRAMNADGTGVTLIVSNPNVPSDLTVDLSNGYIYWCATVTDSVMRSNLDGSNVVTLVSTGLDFPNGIEIDPIAGHIYVTNFSSSQIIRTNLDGSNFTVIHNISTPRGIGLDLGAGKMYYQSQGNLQILRSNLDGTAVEILATTGLYPHDLDVDPSGGKVYWVELGAEKLRRMNLDGTGVEDLVTTGTRPRGVALGLDTGKVWWTKPVLTRTISRANFDGSVIEDVLVGAPLSDPWGIAVVPAAPGLLLIDFDLDPQGVSLPAGTEVNLAYQSLGVIFDRVGPGTLCGPEVYANSDQPIGFGSSPNVVSVCNEGGASDISENGFGMVEATLAANASQVCVDVLPDGPTHAAVLRAFDSVGLQIGEVTSALGVTQTLCISGAGIRSIRFSGNGSLFARFDNVSVQFLPEPRVSAGLMVGLLLLTAFSRRTRRA